MGLVDGHANFVVSLPFPSNEKLRGRMSIERCLLLVGIKAA